MDLDPRYFQNVLKYYEEWKIKWWREAIQNSADAGAKNIVCSAKPEDPLNGDSPWTVTCEDDGGGMTEEVLVTKFLRFGGTTKTASGGSAGGFGVAKELLILPWLSWEVHTRDKIARGQANEYEIFPAEHLDGTRLTVRMAADNYTYGAAAIAFIEKSYLPDVRFKVDGKPYRAELQGKDLLRSLPGKLDLYFTPAKSTSYRMLIRAKGLFMFEVYVGEELEGFILGEITGPSIELLSANRDSFRDREVKYEVEAFAQELAKDVRSATRNRAGLIRQVFKGEGKFIARDRAERAARHVGPVSSGAPREDIVREILTSVSEFHDVEPPRREPGASPPGAPPPDAPPPAPRPAPEAMKAMLDLAPPIKDREDVERAIKQLIWKPDFFIMNDAKGYKVSKEFFPATMSPRVTKLASVWTELCRFVLIQLGSASEYGVGFFFDHNAAAASVVHEGEHWLVLNPFRNMREFKDLWRPSVDEDLQWLYAAAIHECTHLADRISYHDESFAAALTHNMAKCSKGWRKVKEIASTIRMGEGRQAGEGKMGVAKMRRQEEKAAPNEPIRDKALRAAKQLFAAGNGRGDVREWLEQMYPSLTWDDNYEIMKEALGQ